MMDTILNDFLVNTARSSKSRKTSLSSFLVDTSYHNSRSHHDKLGFKKLAKACSRSIWNPTDHQGKPITMSQSEKQVNSSKFETFSLLSRRYRHQAHGNHDDSVTEWKTYFDTKKNHEQKLFEPHNSKLKASEEELQDSVITSDAQRLDAGVSHDSDKNQNQVRDNAAHSKVLEKNHNIVNLTMNQLNLDDCIAVRSEKVSEEGRRVIELKNFPLFVGVKSVISQICGGPLEKIKEVGASDQLKNLVVEVWFLKSFDATEFLKYSYSGLFLVNGFHIAAEWAPRTHDFSYHAELDPTIKEEMEVNGASRCLILKKYISKKLSNRSTYPSPLKNYSDNLRLDEIKEYFGNFGLILEVSPVISKKLCIAIHYFEVQSAIAAKKEFDGKLSELYEKYHDWTLWYGKDPCDKVPCINF